MHFENVYSFLFIISPLFFFKYVIVINKKYISIVRLNHRGFLLKHCWEARKGQQEDKGCANLASVKCNTLNSNRPFSWLVLLVLGAHQSQKVSCVSKAGSGSQLLCAPSLGVARKPLILLCPWGWELSSNAAARLQCASESKALTYPQDWGYRLADCHSSLQGAWEPLTLMHLWGWEWILRPGTLISWWLATHLF